MTTIASGASLRIEGIDAAVEMGKYLDLQIVYEGESVAGNADLQQWADAFFIDVRDSGTENLLSGAIRTTQRLRLYPRSPGEALLERIALGGAVAGPARVAVVPTVRNGIDGTPRWTPLPDRVWQGQSFEIGVDAALMHPSNQIALEDAVLPGFDLQPLPRQTDSRDGVDVVRLRWRVTALTPGRHRLELPPIEQRGRGRWRFYLHAPEVRVAPLPSYLPPSVPVGVVALESAMARIDGRDHWKVIVRNRGRLPETTYGLRASLAVAAGLDPERVEVSGIETDPSAGYTVQRYQAPLPDWSFGWGGGPPVSLRYFDTDAGRLVDIQTRLPSAWQLPTYARLIWLAIAVLLIVLLAVRLTHAVRRYLSRRRLRKQVTQAPDAHALRRLLISSSGHPTLTDWAGAKRDPGAAEAAGLINRACFSRDLPPDPAVLKQALLLIQLP